MTKEEFIKQRCKIEHQVAIEYGKQIYYEN